MDNTSEYQFNQMILGGDPTINHFLDLDDLDLASSGTFITGGDEIGDETGESPFIVDTTSAELEVELDSPYLTFDDDSDKSAIDEVVGGGTYNISMAINYIVSNLDL
jgi:hypothetical protein